MRLGLGRPRGYWVHPVVKQRLTRGIFLVLLLLLLFFGLFSFRSGLRPNIVYLCEAQTKALGMQVVQQALGESLQNVGADALSLVEKREDGRITAVRSNTREMNLLVSRFTQNMYDRLSHMPEDEICIALGSVLSRESFLANRGPRIPIKVRPAGYADVSFDSAFVPAGINQVQHQILLHVDMQLTAYFPGVRTDVPVRVDIPLEQMVIVGDVPDSYTNFQAAEDTVEDKFLDID